VPTPWEQGASNAVNAFGRSGCGGRVRTDLPFGEVFGASRVAYTLELGGNNHSVEWLAGTRVPYTRGSAADGQSFYQGHLLNYAVVLEASGNHEQTGHPSNGLPIWGAANIVFDLKLTTEAGAAVPDALFKSTINETLTPEPAVAAFALSFGYYQTGRLIDRNTYGGPRLEPIFTYPTQPPASGELIGMGAGYKEWIRSVGETMTEPGVGMVTMPNGMAGLGVVPIAEGQVDISLLPVGTYKLQVTPGSGNNVLRGDVNLYQNPAAAFAVAANETAGDTITFTVTDEPPPEPCTPGIVGVTSCTTTATSTGTPPA